LRYDCADAIDDDHRYRGANGDNAASQTAEAFREILSHVFAFSSEVPDGTGFIQSWQARRESLSQHL